MEDVNYIERTGYVNTMTSEYSTTIKYKSCLRNSKELTNLNTDILSLSSILSFFEIIPYTDTKPRL